MHKAWENRIVGYGEEAPDQLMANPRNARIHPKFQQDALKGVLDEVGWVQNVIVNRASGAIVDGHLRVTLAMRHDQPLVPVTYVDLTDAQEAEILATLDPITALAVYDKEQLDALLHEGQSGEAGVQAMLAELAKDSGLYQEPKEAPEPQVDRAEELRAKWDTARGQLWEIPSLSVSGRCHRLLCGDSTSAEDVTRLMNGERARLFATDPPYLVGYTGTNHPHKWNEPDSNKDWSDSYHDWDDASQGEELYDGFVATAVQHAVTEDAAWYCWHASRNQAMLERVWERYGAFVHQQIIWVKDRPILTRSWYMWQHEPCFFGWVKGQKPPRTSEDYPASVWTFPTVPAGERTDHPTSKPVELFAIPMAQHTRLGEVCYEPFSGSGSQQVAGEQNGRLVYGLELQPQFVAVILERLAGMGLEPRLVEGA